MPTIGPSQGAGLVLINSVAMSGAANSDPYRLPKKSRSKGSDDIVLQISVLLGDADVQIQGRVDHTHAWVDMMTTVVDEVSALTFEALQTFAWVPEIRVEVTNVASTPTVFVSIFHG